MIAKMPTVDKATDDMHRVCMTKLHEIEEAVTHMPISELSEFRHWFARFDAEEWDREFEDDAKSGLLDQFAEKALKDLAEERCSKL